MSDSRLPPSADETTDERDTARLLAAVGGRPQPDAATLARWSTTFAAELAPAIAARRRRRRWFALTALAATTGLAIGAGLLGSLPMPEPEPVAVARVAAAFGSPVIGTQPAVPGQFVHAGDVVGSAAGDRLVLVVGNAELRLAEMTRIRLHADGRVGLQSGALYVDSRGVDDAAAGATPAIVIETAYGNVTHVGTQFVVRLSADALRVSVRKGEVAVQTAQGRFPLAATADIAPVATVAASGAVTVERAPCAAANWGWLPAASPGFDIGRERSSSVLARIARDGCLEVVYADAAARALADSDAAMLERGEGLSFDTILRAIDGATGLSVSHVDDQLRIGRD